MANELSPLRIPWTNNLFVLDDFARLETYPRPGHGTFYVSAGDDQVLMFEVESRA
jgi:hypothetical protein